MLDFKSFNYAVHFLAGVVETEGKLWQDHRRFALSVLRDFGLGKAILESTIQDECYILLDELKKQ